jgi:hypothetical protein
MSKSLHHILTPHLSQLCLTETDQYSFPKTRFVISGYGFGMRFRSGKCHQLQMQMKHFPISLELRSFLAFLSKNTLQLF